MKILVEEGFQTLGELHGMLLLLGLIDSIPLIAAGFESTDVDPRGISMTVIDSMDFQS